MPRAIPTQSKRLTQHHSDNAGAYEDPATSRDYTWLPACRDGTYCGKVPDARKQGRRPRPLAAPKLKGGDIAG